MTAAPELPPIRCRACARVRDPRAYVCGRCWSALPIATRRALTKRDALALDRLHQLHAHIDRNQPLERLEIIQ